VGLREKAEFFWVANLKISSSKNFDAADCNHKVLTEGNSYKHLSFQGV
jgi:hypothetical protein